MRSMNELLKVAERDWRVDVKRDQPLWSNVPVITEGKQEPGRDWSFSTDLKRIFALVFNDERLRQRFTDDVPKYWAGEPEALARDTMHYLLFHELYHPIEAPFSVQGDTSDKARIHQAIRAGALRAQPNLSPLEQTVKVSASQNMVKDFILDNRFFLDNVERGYVRSDIIPVWDFLEIGSSPAQANMYTITRFLYGALYGPDSTHSIFAEKAQGEGVKVAAQALGALIQQGVTLPQSPSLAAREKSLLKGGVAPVSRETLTEYVYAIRSVFAGEDRYKGIERFMQVLSPYVKSDMPQGRPDQQGEGSGTSTENIMQDLLAGMTPQEQASFVQGLTQEIDQGIEKNLSMGSPDSVKNAGMSKDQLTTLETAALHEFYKHNHPSVQIIGGQKTGETVVVGKRQTFALKRSSVLSPDELAKLNLGNIARFQQKTRLPMLIPLDNGQFRLNEYEVRERELKDIVYVDSAIDVPDEVDLYLDSSGSMYQGAGNQGFNDGSSWDMLSNVLYGFVDALVQGSRALKKPCSMRIRNVADSQISSPFVPVQDFWAGRSPEALKVLFRPENGYNQENLDIQINNDGKRRAYVVVTDGNLVMSGRTERESAKMRQLAKQPRTDVVLFEIGGTYGLGEAVRNDPNVHYYKVHNKEDMLRNGLEVLLAK